jgi:hypothetical protein
LGWRLSPAASPTACRVEPSYLDGPDAGFGGIRVSVRRPGLAGLRLDFRAQAASAAFTPTFQATIPDVLTNENDYTRALSLSRIAYDMDSLLSPHVRGRTADCYHVHLAVRRDDRRLSLLGRAGGISDGSPTRSLGMQKRHLRQHDARNPDLSRDAVSAGFTRAQPVRRRRWRHGHRQHNRLGARRLERLRSGRGQIDPKSLQLDHCLAIQGFESDQPPSADNGLICYSPSKRTEQLFIISRRWRFGPPRCWVHCRGSQSRTPSSRS